jgi:hypothetical protein
VCARVGGDSEMPNKKAGSLTTEQARLLGFSITLSGVSFEVFSAHCSSPWTSETFGSDPKKARSARNYVWRSIIVTEIIGAGGAMLYDSSVPFIATSIACAYMWATYHEALRIAASNNEVDSYTATKQPTFY